MQKILKAAVGNDCCHTLTLLTAFEDGARGCLERRHRGSRAVDFCSLTGLLQHSGPCFCNVMDVEGGASSSPFGSYDAFMQELIKDPSKISTAVEAGYDKIDMRFLERVMLWSCEARDPLTHFQLNEKMQEDGPQKELLTQLNSAIQACMSARIQKASDALQKVLKAGDLNGMRKELMLLNVRGGEDG